MAYFQYKVIPAPRRGPKVTGVKTPEARFALGLEDTLNEMSREGWCYLRSDILPSEERQGLASTHVVYRSVLVFRREIPDAPPAGGAETQAGPSAATLAGTLSPPDPEK